MPKRIAIVDQQTDLVEFLCEQIQLRGYEVVATSSVEAAYAIEPAPDLILYDFTYPVDLSDLFEMIEVELRPSVRKTARR